MTTKQELVLVTGGNGFIGSALVRFLLAKGKRVRCLIHRSHRLLDGLDVELVKGSLQMASSLREAMLGVEVVYHLAGTGKAGDWGDRDWFFSVNAGGTRRLLDAALDAGARRFVHLSSLAVHRFVGHVDADESTPANQRHHAYGASKAEAEHLVRAVGAAGRLQTVVVRPGFVIFGPKDTTSFVHMAPLLSKGRWSHVDGGRHLMCYSYVDNLADGLVLAGEHERAAGEIFNVHDGLKLSWREFISAVIRAFGVTERSISVPSFIARPAGIGLETLFRVLRIPKAPPITDYRTELASSDLHFSCAKAQSLLGYRARVPFEEGLARTVAWYRENR